MQFIGLAKAIYNKNMLFAGFDYGYIHSVNTLQKMIDYLNKYKINLVN